MSTAHLIWALIEHDLSCLTRRVRKMLRKNEWNWIKLKQKRCLGCCQIDFFLVCQRFFCCSIWLCHFVQSWAVNSFLLFAEAQLFNISRVSRKKGWKPQTGNYLIIIFRFFLMWKRLGRFCSFRMKTFWVLCWNAAKTSLLNYSIIDSFDIKKSFFIHKALDTFFGSDTKLGTRFYEFSLALFLKIIWEYLHVDGISFMMINFWTF